MGSTRQRTSIAELDDHGGVVGEAEGGEGGVGDIGERGVAGELVTVASRLLLLARDRANIDILLGVVAAALLPLLDDDDDTTDSFIAMTGRPAVTGLFASASVSSGGKLIALVTAPMRCVAFTD